MKLQSVLLGLLLVITHAVCTANTGGNISVKAVEAGTTTPVEYFSARIKGKSIGFLSDHDGLVNMNLDRVDDSDTLSLSCIGYETCDIRVGNLSDGMTVAMKRRRFELPEVCARPRKCKTVKQGKKHSFGISTMPFYEKRGSIIGIESDSKGKAQWLTSIGFHIKPTADRLSKMKFRISVYDGADVKGRETTDFKDCGIKPVYVDYQAEMIDDDRFSHKFSEPIQLPHKAMIAIEFLDDMGNERIRCRHNILGGGVWTASPSSSHWIKFPVATPFFIEIIQAK